MSRLPVQIRTAVPADAEALVALWVASTEGQPVRPAPPTTEEAARSILRVQRDPAQSLQVAVVDDDVVGVAHLSRTPVSPLHEGDAVHVSHLFVTPLVRGRGVGRSLLAAAAAWADASGAAHLLTAVAAGSRDANRFLACLGLSQTAMVRSVPVPVLRQRLGQRLGQRRAVGDGEPVDTPALKARRRIVLRRQIRARAAAEHPAPEHAAPVGTAVGR